MLRSSGYSLPHRRRLALLMFIPLFFSVRLSTSGLDIQPQTVRDVWRPNWVGGAIAIGPGVLILPDLRAANTLQNRRRHRPNTARPAHDRSRSPDCRQGTRTTFAAETILTWTLATETDHPQRVHFQRACLQFAAAEMAFDFKPRGVVRRQWTQASVFLWPVAMLRVSLTVQQISRAGRLGWWAGLRRCRWKPAFGRDRVGGSPQRWRIPQ